MPLALFALFLIGYLAGSIPFGLLLTKMAGLGDVRRIGSGNIGATNVLRTGRKGLAAATLLLDMLKGLVPVIVVKMLAGEPAATITAAGAFFGHVFPVWLGFKGGKGVATALGVLTGFHWAVGLATMGTWLLVAFLSRISSLSALVAAAAAPAYVWWLLGQPVLTTATTLMSALLYWRHRGNIRNLIAGTEGRINLGSKG